MKLTFDNLVAFSLIKFTCIAYHSKVDRHKNNNYHYFSDISKKTTACIVSKYQKCSLDLQL